MLNQFSQISAPHPPHLLKTFVPLLPYYGNLDNQSFSQLSSDVVEYVNTNPVPWEMELSPEEVVKRCRSKNIFEVLRVIYQAKAEYDGAVIWCSKSMHNAYYYQQLEVHRIQPFYIYLYRDGRDVAASFRKTVIGPKHAFHIAKKWQEDQLKAKEVHDRVGESRFFSIKYEELVQQPERIIRGLCNAIRLPYSQEVMNFYNSHESIITASSGRMWSNLTKPIMSNHYGMYKNELNAEDINIFEMIAGNVLKSLNYNNLDDFGGEKRLFSDSEIERFNLENKKMMEEVRRHAPEQDMKRRSKQEHLLQTIKDRLSVPQS